MFTASSRTFPNALIVNQNQVEHRPSIAQLRVLHDHMLHQFALSGVQLMAMWDAVDDDCKKSTSLMRKILSVI